MFLDRLDVGMSSGRYQRILWAMQGLEKTGVPLVGWDGVRYFKAEKAEDMAICYVVPKIAAFFGISVDAALAVFVLSITLLSFGAGLAGVWALCRSRGARLLAVPLLGLVALITILSWDTYIGPPSCVAAVVPWFIYFHRRGRMDGRFLAFLFGAGIVMCAANYVRSHAGTGVLAFVAVALALQRGWPVRRKIAGAGAIAAGFLIPFLMASFIFSRRDAYLRQVQPDAPLLIDQHPFWHSIYIGLSFLDNEYGPPKTDHEAKAIVAAISPETVFWSAEYERIVKEQVFRLAAAHPFFILRSVFAKLGVLAMYLLVFLNVGLIAAWFGRKDPAVESAFLAGMAVTALPGVLVTPYYFYVLALFAFAALYAVISVEQAAGTNWIARTSGALRRRLLP